MEKHYGDLNYARASVTRACSGREIPYLVSVSGYFNDNKLWLYFLTERPIKEDELDELQCASTEVMADFYQLRVEEFVVTGEPIIDVEHFMVRDSDFS